MDGRRVAKAGGDEEGAGLARGHDVWTGAEAQHAPNALIVAGKAGRHESSVALLNPYYCVQVQRSHEGQWRHEGDGDPCNGCRRPDERIDDVAHGEICWKFEREVHVQRDVDEKAEEPEEAEGHERQDPQLSRCEGKPLVMILRHSSSFLSARRVCQLLPASPHPALESPASRRRRLNRWCKACDHLHLPGVWKSTLVLLAVTVAQWP